MEEVTGKLKDSNQVLATVSRVKPSPRTLSLIKYKKTRLMCTCL